MDLADHGGLVDDDHAGELDRAVDVKLEIDPVLDVEVVQIGLQAFDRLGQLLDLVVRCGALGDRLLALHLLGVEVRFQLAHRRGLRAVDRRVDRGGDRVRVVLRLQLVAHDLRSLAGRRHERDGLRLEAQLLQNEGQDRRLTRTGVAADVGQRLRVCALQARHHRAHSVALVFSEGGHREPKSERKGIPAGAGPAGSWSVA
jgi:hypothetical protein